MNSQMEMAPTVFVVDDDISHCETVCGMVSTMGLPVRSFSSAISFKEYYQPEFKGCLILGITLATQNGIDLYQEMITSGIRLPVIFNASRPKVATVVSAVKLGAVEFLEKPIASHVLKRHIEEALNMDQKWREEDRKFAELAEKMGTLTEREQETLDLLVKGETNKSMAAKLFITERAIEMRRANIMNKLQVRSVAELLDRAITYRLLSKQREEAASPHLV